MTARPSTPTIRHALVIGADRAFGTDVVERLLTNGFAVITNLAALPDATPLDTLIVNLCGTTQETPFRSVTDEQFRSLLDDRLYLFVDSVQAAIPRMVEGGTIVQIAPKSFLGAWGGVHVAATAAACIAIARSMAIEFRPLDIRVNTVAVGYPDEQARDARERESIAATVAWLAGTDSDQVSGETILADRGASLQMAQAARR